MAGSTYAPPVLSTEELVAESIFGLMASGKLGREGYCRRMSALDATPEGTVASCYCSWLLLRNLPSCSERNAHLATMRRRLRAATCEISRLSA